jgi:hypothetical protein
MSSEVTAGERNPKISIVRHEIECKVVEPIDGPYASTSERVDEVRRCVHGDIQIIRDRLGNPVWCDLPKETTEYALAFEALDTRTDVEKKRDALMDKLDALISLFTYLFFLLGVGGFMVLGISGLVGGIILGLAGLFGVSAIGCIIAITRLGRKK